MYFSAFDCYEIAQGVFSRYSNYATSRLKLDPGCEWVKGYLRDAAIREEIEKLEQDIMKMHTLPIERNELKSSFILAMKNMDQQRVSWLVEYLKEVQNRRAPMLDVATVRRNVAFLPLEDKDINDIFDRLEAGTNHEVITKEVAKARKKIQALEKRIEQECSPQSRWLYEDDGTPLPYPRGCRWTAAVDVWKRVACRFSGPVTIDGEPIRTEGEAWAYQALALAEELKKTPLLAPDALYPS